MGQKINPNSYRMGSYRTWDSKWFAKGKEFTKTLHEDLKVRNFVEKKLKEAGLSRIEILRTSHNVTLNVYTGRPGNIIGKGGSAVEELKAALEKMTGDKYIINIREVKKPTLDARLAAENIVQQIEKRISYRRAAKMLIEKALEAGALGAKVLVAGRLNGVEISRSEFFTKGKVPLQTLRADIDYALVPAHTAYGLIGVKVWIFRGMVFKKKSAPEDQMATAE
ncbi:MAG: 30S ribosomal protein S3 [Candidatus Peregrinibacteria bacterium]|nr:30S ribosomal protein S3 [Candidatus Peregrinibacteria bacterium]